MSSRVLPRKLAFLLSYPPLHQRQWQRLALRLGSAFVIFVLFGLTLSIASSVAVTTATKVYGQNDSFATGIPNYGSSTVSAFGLYNPTSVAADNEGGFYIVDSLYILLPEYLPLRHGVRRNYRH